MTKNLKIKYILTTIVAIGIVFLPISNVKAVLQANGAEGVIYNLNEYIKNVRKMEELGGALGLSESINGDLTTNGDSNNIDVHMQKNTEYGALAILSASSYGNPNKIEDGDTTTGNITGAVMKLNNEWVAAGTTIGATDYYGAKSRYKNIQSANYERRKGDALAETNGWHGSTINVWHVDSEHLFNLHSGIVRSISGSIFSYSTRAVKYVTGAGWRPTEIAHWTKEYCSRAVIVSGEGI